ncbi:PREDICTED: BTB/POZ domain-containing protein At3g08570-like isoform X1 [Nicotiana attenuata]|uniref:Btbpoz domain-containing protein n=2 Tax=Nicotiana attenuata TaxID=49451 RepID=A0A1J6IFC2_NICAT|nr:PREDICTED: BTB/POZ domain-containing protein At3g08570-like isoform X1 [Nicotiana attenuata]XP_019257500.1 PREDICTED: BTB/POZ domain-containing protein At3g08570-like isoform X1 [Nicotiana attenuata]OIS96446.1 btbpoz domain-containing protein [Nicotiana attenuata]
MVSPYNSFTTRTIFSEVAGDITIAANGESFLLHKFPLVSLSGKIRKMVADANDPNLSELDLNHVPGGPETFELAAKFCYGMNFEITTTNVARLRCVAEYLEMTEDYREENLIARTETFLDEVVSPSLEKSVQVLSSCDALLPTAEEVGIPDKCIDAITRNACQEQLVSSLSRLDCDSGSLELKDRCLEWWVEDLSVLSIDFYRRVIMAMGHVGVHIDSIIASLMHYAQVSLKGIGKPQIWNPARSYPCKGEKGQRTIIETLVSLLPPEKSSSVPLNFLFGMLRIGIMVDATLACRLEIERRIAFRLEMVLLDDLLIPSVQTTGDSLFDVDTVKRILIHFLQRIDQEENEDCGYESEGIDSPSHGALLKVGRLIDTYLAEIAPDPYLSLDKFTAMISVLPDYARIIDDGLYRAIDVYLKAHPTLSEHEAKKLCKFIDCQKLSQEACNHAAQNERLPVQMTVRVLYFEQLCLKNALSGSCGDTFVSQKISSGLTSAAMSPRDTYASLRRENRELKLEISRMRVRLSDLEKEQVFMKQGMMDKTGHGKTFLTSLSRGIGRFGIFGNPSGEKHHKSGRKSRTSEGKTGRSRRYSLS